MKKATKLKLIIVKEGLTQRKVSKEAKIDEATFSLICNGRYIPTPVQQARIAEAMKKPVTELFELES